MALQDPLLLKKLQLSQSREHCLIYQLWALTSKFFQLRYPINTKKSAIFAKYYHLNFDNNKNDRFRRRRKTTKITFFPSEFLLKSSLQAQKSTFPAKLSPSPSLAGNFFALISCSGWAAASRSSAYRPCLDFQHHHRTACWEIATIFDHARCFSHTFHIYTKSTATPTYHWNFLLVVFFSGRNFQNIPWSVEKFIQSRVPRLLCFVAAIFPVQRTRSQIRKWSTTPNSLHWESGLWTTFRLNDAHQAATKDEKRLWTYQESRIHLIWTFIAIQRSKITTSRYF